MVNTAKPDSVRSMGLTYIATDKPTRAKLKEAAYSQGLTLAEYLRYVANLPKEQGRLVRDMPAYDATLPAIASKVSAILSAIDRWENPSDKRSLSADMDTMARWICKQLGLNPDAGVVDTFKVWYEAHKAKQAGQLTLKEDMA